MKIGAASTTLSWNRATSAGVALFQLITGRAAPSVEVVARLSAAESYSPS